MMELDTQKKLAALLRGAATQTVTEKDFWAQFTGLVDPVTEPVAGLAYESATHYWGNFHQRNLFLIRVKPDRHQLLQGQNELNLIADALDANWPVSELERKLKDI
ncbi:MAG TPA: hypothetical protein VHV29_01820 [Terriglobales bacterium]|nr:hypothetical protein [Terriglobales bacterium]